MIPARTRLSGIVALFVVALALLTVGVGGVAADSTVSADAGDASVTLEPANQTVDPGADAVYDVVVTNATDGVGSFGMSVEQSTPSVATFESFDPAKSPLFDDSTVSDDQLNISVAMGSNTFAGANEITLGTITLTGNETGDTDLTFVGGSSDVVVNDENNDPYTITGTTGAGLSVSSAIANPSLSISPPDETVEVGSSNNTTVVAEDIGNGISSFNVTIGLDNTTVVSFGNVSVPGDSNPTVTESGGSLTVDATPDTTEAGDITLFSVPVSGDAIGTTNVSFERDSLVDADGQSYTVENRTNATRSVIEANDDLTADEVALEIRPTDGGAESGATATYEAVVRGPSNGINAYEANITVADTTVAEIVGFNTTKSASFSNNRLNSDGSKLILQAGMGNNNYGPAPEIPIVTFNVTATGTATESTTIAYEQNVPTDVSDNNDDFYALAGTEGANFTVERSGPANFTLSNFSASAGSVVNGTAVTFSADVQNTGGETGTQTVELGLGGYTETTDLTLASNETDTVGFVNVDTGLVGPGDYTPTISSANDSVSGSLTVLQEATFTVSNIDPADEQVANGSTLDISADVTNVGGVQDTKTVTLTVGSITKTQSVTRAAGENQTVTFQDVDTGTLGLGNYTHTISTPDDAGSGNLTVVEQAAFAVSNLDPADTTVVNGSTLDISVDIENTGDVEGTQTVELTIGEFSTTKSVTVSAGANQTVTFQNVDTGALGPGSYTHIVSSTNDEVSGSLKVLDRATFTVSNIDPADGQAVNGSTLDVSADVENTGDVQGTQTVELAIDGFSATKSVTVGASATQTVTFQDVDTTALGPGNYTHTISSANDSASGSLQVLERGRFLVSNLSPLDGQAVNGTEIDISADVENAGEAQDTQTVELSVGSLSLTKSVTLSGGANQTVTFQNVDTGTLGPGNYTHAVTTANDSVSGSLQVLARAQFDVSNLSPSDGQAVNGSTLDISADVANTGEVQGTQTVELAIDGFSATKSVTLAAGASQTVTFQDVDTTALGPGTYTHTISSANDSASGSLQVLQRATFTASTLDPADATVVNGTEINISADIENVGDVQGTQTVELTVDGVTQTTSLTLAGGANQTVTFQNIDTGALGVGNYTHAVTTDNDSVSGDLTVIEEPTAATFLLSNLDPRDAEVVNGTTIDISAAVENVGGVEGTQTVTLSAGGLSLTKSVTLSGGANQTVTFQNVDTGALGPGTYTHAISTANDTAVGDLTVLRAAEFVVSNVDPADGQAVNGSEIDVSADIENVGDVDATQTVTLTIDGFSTTKSVTLAAGTSQTVTFEDVDTGALGPGSYTHTISSANDSASGSLQVLQRATFNVSAISPSDGQAVNRSTLDISAVVENVGDLQATQTVTLTVDGVSATKSVTLAPGASEIVTFEDVDTGLLGPGTYTHTISTANDSASGSLQVLQRPTFTVSNLDPADGQAMNGSTLDISADVANVGDLDGTQTVELTIDGFTATQSVTLAAGTSQTVTFEDVDTTALGPGTYTHTISSANDSASGSLQVLQQATFTASTLDPANPTVVNGTEITISADIENVGDVQGTQTVELTVDGVTQTTSVTLAGGANQTVTFQNIDTGALGVGTYTHTVTTDNDSVSGDLTVIEEPTAATFLLSNLDPRDAEVANGTDIDISVDVENAGDVEGTQTVALSIDGFSTSQSVTLSGGATQTVTFQNVDTTVLGPGAYTHTVTTANDTATGNLSVLRPVEFAVSNIDPADAEVVNGSTLDISADIENVGDVQGTQTVTLSVGSLTQTTSVTLAAGANQTVTFEDVDTTALGPGSYTHTISSANDSASGSLQVLQRATFDVSNLTPSDGQAVNGTTLDISADVENTGEVQGTQTVTLSVGSFTQTTSVTLAAGANQTVTFEDVDTTALGPGSYTHTISSANDSASGSLQVLQQTTFDVRNLSPSDGQAVNGTTIDISATVENVGDVDGTQTVELTIDGFTTSQSVTLAAGTTQTVTFEDVDTTALGPGEYTHTISSANDSASGSLQVLQRATFTASTLDPADPTVVNGTEIALSADIENAGDVQGTQTVTLTVGSITQTQSVTLSGGATETVTFQNVDTTALGPGTYTQTVTTQNDSVSGNLTVIEEPTAATFLVSDLTPRDAAVVNGTAIDISATIENVGAAQGTQTVSLGVGSLTQTKSVTLASDATQTVTFQNVDTGALGPGAYTHAISTANDTATGDLSVLQQAEFAVTNIDPADAEVVSGTELNLSADIQNVGDVQDTQFIELSVGGFNTAQSVKLAGSATETVTFSVNTGSLGPGNYTHTISSADDSASGTVRVLRPAEIVLSGLDPANASVPQGSTVTISADVENVGDIETTTTTDLLIGGTVIGNSTVTVSGGETQTVAFQDVDTAALGPGTYTHIVAGGGDSVSGTLTVERPTVEIRPNQTEVRSGLQTTVEVVVTNVGNGVGAYDIEVGLNSSAATFVDYAVTGTGTDNSAISADNASLSLNVSLDSALAGEETVIANATLAISEPGPVEVLPTAVSVSDASDTSYSPTRTGTVISGFGPPPVIGNTPPNDLTGDGLYEDVRGSGTLEIFDVQALFANLDTAVVQNYARFYNFQQEDPDEVTIFDVQQLFIRFTEIGEA